MKFGVREIVDVVFKATEDNQKVGALTFKKYQPVFMIDTATTSSLEQATTTVYAQGGKGYARLIAWEGEKTMTFTVTDALMSPMGLAVLTGAGLIKPSNTKAEEMHVHCTINASVKNNGTSEAPVYIAEISLDDLRNETGLHGATEFKVCASTEVPAYATLLDGSGAGIGWYSNVVVTADSGKTYRSVSEDAKAVFTITPQSGEPVPSGTVQLDFYLVMNNDAAVQEVDIEPGSFGGYFYVEAQTLFRREDSGQDMAAEIIIPKAKIQSAFTFTMAASGDPSTFDFVMDAMPGYVRFDTTKKLMCKIQILGVDSTEESASGAHDHTDLGETLTPSFKKPDTPTPSTDIIDISGSKKVGTSTIPASFPYSTEYQANQGVIKSVMVDDNGDLVVTLEADSLESLEKWTSTDPGQATLGDQDWLAIDIATGTDDITKIKYNGYDLTSEDVADAAAWGLGNGHIILWIRAAAVAASPKGIILSGDGFETLSFKVKVEEEV